MNIEIDDKLIEDKLKLYRGVSFSETLKLLRSEAGKYRIAGKTRFPSFLLDSKIITHEFANLLDVKSPKMYQVDCSINDIFFKKNVVVKPVAEASARGVFISGENEIVYLNKNTKFDNQDDAKKYACQLLERNLIKQDKWMVEELLVEDDNLAHDIKFYMFYGEVGLVLESARLPKVQRCWYDSKLNKVKTGKYDKLLFKGNIENLEAIADLAKNISLKVPAPFLRIDFLVNNNEIYLGEFTPVPQGSDQFTHAWDKRLGEMYQRACTRLAYDCAMGKVFEEYISLVKDESKIIERINNFNKS